MAIQNRENKVLGTRSKTSHISLMSKSAIAVAIAQMLACNTYAFDYVVNHAGDERGIGADEDGQCTLREAIHRANLNDAAGGPKDCDPTGTVGNDIITFNIAGPSATINLEGTLNSGGDRQLTIDDDLTIDAFNFINPLRIEWNSPNSYVASILRLENTAASPTAKISINNVRITGAKSLGNGGGIFVGANVDAELDTVTISENSAAHGGGIAVDELGKIVITNSTIETNSCGSAGGGLWVDGYKENSAGNRGVLTIIDSVVTNNTSGSSAGGIASYGNVVLQNTYVTNNRADAGAAGILARYGSLEVLNQSIISGNSAASSGGGIRAAAKLTVADSTISSNTAGSITASSSDSGGGILFSGSEAANHSLTITNSLIEKNTAGYQGAGILIFGGTNSIMGSSINQNELVKSTGSASRGGGIQNTGSTLVISNSDMANNIAQKGGGIRTSSDLRIESSTISSNTATGNGGGGLYIAYGNVYIIESTLSENSASRGGGVFAFGGNLYLENSTISNNSAGDGAGILVSDGPFFGTSISSSTIAFNKGGSGLKLAIAGFASINNSIMSDNELFDCEKTAVGPLNGNTNNLAGTQSGCGMFTYQGISPLLAPLQDNGGPTFTHGLCKNSPAIDQGDNAVCVGDGITNDQRGEPRVDGSCDIGAYEAVEELICETGSFFIIPVSSGRSVIFDL